MNQVICIIICFDVVRRRTPRDRKRDRWACDDNDVTCVTVRSPDERKLLFPLARDLGWLREEPRCGVYTGLNNANIVYGSYSASYVSETRPRHPSISSKGRVLYISCLSFYKITLKQHGHLGNNPGYKMVPNLCQGVGCGTYKL